MANYLCTPNLIHKQWNQCPFMRTGSQFLLDSYFRKNVFTFRTQKTGREKILFVSRCFAWALRKTCNIESRWKDLMEHKIVINMRFSAWLEGRLKRLIHNVKSYYCAQMQARDRTLRRYSKAKVHNCWEVPYKFVLNALQWLGMEIWLEMLEKDFIKEQKFSTTLENLFDSCLTSTTLKINGFWKETVSVQIVLLNFPLSWSKFFMQTYTEL